MFANLTAGIFGAQKLAEKVEEKREAREGSKESAAGSEEFDDETQDKIHYLLQQYSVLLEYQNLQDLLPSGVYLVPSLNTLLTWHGTMFVRQGLFKGAVFKFDINLSEDYPETRPEVRFTSEMCHPLVQAKTGKFQIEAFFPEWTAGEHYVASVIPIMHKAITRTECFTTDTDKKPLNPDALALFQRDRAGFLIRAAEVTQKSLKQVYTNSPGSSLQFTKNPAAAHDEILQKLRNKDPSQSLEQRTVEFADWFCEHYSKQRAFVSLGGKFAVETIPIEARGSGGHTAEEDGYAPKDGWGQADDDEDSASDDDKGEDAAAEREKKDVLEIKRQLQTAQLLRKAQRRFKEALAKGASQSKAIERQEKTGR